MSKLLLDKPCSSVSSMERGSTSSEQWPPILARYLPEVMAGVLLVHMWEEVGWMGFALPRLQRRAGPVAASAIIGVLFTLFHLLLFLVSDFPSLGSAAFYLLLMMLVAIPHRIVLTWIFNKTDGSVLLGARFHGAFKASNAHLGQLIPAVPDDFTVYALLLGWDGAAVRILAATRGRLSYAPEFESSVEAL